MDAKRFLCSLGLSVLAIAGTLAGINAVADPYLMMGLPRWQGFNAVKPAVLTREAMMKAYHAPKIQSRTLVMGSSRADIGLNPQDPAWPEKYRPVYNLSIVGSGLDLGLQYARHMLATNGQQIPTTTLVIGLDFETFLAKSGGAADAPPRDEGLYERLALLPDGTPNGERGLRTLKDYGAALFSLDALMDSAQVFVASRGGLEGDMREDGHLHPGQLMRWARDDGFASVFDKKYQQFLESFGKVHRGLALEADGQGFKSVDALFEFARGKDLKIVLMIQPMHVSQLEVMDLLGYWPELEQWKRVLTRSVAQARAAGVDAALWDFSTYETLLQERVPVAGDRKTTMKWFWDPVHQQEELGSLMLSRMLEPDSRVELGQRLEPATVEPHLERIRRQREAYRLSQPAEVQRVRKVVCGDGDCRGGARQQVADGR